MEELRAQARMLAEKFIREESDYFLGGIDAEQSNPKTRTLSETIKENTENGVRMLQSVDQDLIPLYRSALESKEFDRLCASIFKALTDGGRIILSGCGSSGRLCMSIEKAFRRAVSEHDLGEFADRVITVMTGGDYALIRAVENLEDYESLSRKQIEDLEVCEKDLLIGVTATGETTSIVGTAIEAAERGADVYMVVCSDVQKMIGKIDRIDRLYSKENVRVIYLRCGAFAIAGSSRMQSSTIEQMVIMSAFESVLCRFLGIDFSKEKLCAYFEKTMDVLTAPSTVRMMADYIEKETAIYQKNGYVTYFSKNYILDLITDTTERGPTFSTPPFRPRGQADQPLSPSFVKNPTMETRDAWRDCFGREMRCLHWDDSVYRSAGITKKMPDISEERLLDFSIGCEAEPEREEKYSAAVWIDEVPPIEEFMKCASPYTEKFSLVFNLGGCGTFMNIFKRIGMKMAINVISTATMALFGRIDGNYMTYLNISNKKLVDRGARIIADLCGVSYKDALTEQYFYSLLPNGGSDRSATQEAIRHFGKKV